jgi:pyruvate dehydrogenase E2 component (dihydrolipoamide acetyltransferase)
MAKHQITVPDIGDFSDVAVIEVYIHEGDTIALDDPIIALESAKAVTDIPSPYEGKITAVHIKEGDLVSKDSLLADIETNEESTDTSSPTEKEEPEVPKQEKQAAKQEITSEPKPEEKKEKQSVPKQQSTQPAKLPSDGGKQVHASPSVRRYARELGVDLTHVSASGPHGRIQKEDVQALVKQALSHPDGAPIAAQPLEDFSVYGPTEIQKLTRIQKVSGPHLQKSWQTIPLVTQFDEADVTELEQFRKQLKKEIAQQPANKQVKISILPFIVKAVVSALHEFPACNASYDAANQQLILKKYYHIGIAVDTPDGLVVPVLRDADKKSVRTIAEELSQLGKRAREGKLKSEDLSGASFSISSLGGIGGTYFTPIINPPESAILGVSKIQKKPVYDGQNFIPRDILPLSLSYDHRVIDGAQGARFTTYLASLLGDIRRLVL